MRGATKALRLVYDVVNISTHTPHAGRDDVIHMPVKTFSISTHTPHAGRD